MGEFSTSRFLPRLSEGIDFGLQSAFLRRMGTEGVGWHLAHTPSQPWVSKGLPTQQGLDMSWVDRAFWRCPAEGLQGA